MANKINMQNIRKKIAYSKPVLDAAEKVAKRRTFDATYVAEQEFSNHVVTKEVDGGPFAANSSGLLGGIENLYSFFGLTSNPISALKQMWKTVRFKGLKSVTFVGKKVFYTYKVSIPIPEEFEGEAELPWAPERNWLTAVSRGGVSGLGYYLRQLGAGRSRGGLQLKKKIRNLKMKTTPYFIQIYNAFAANFKNSPKA